MVSMYVFEMDLSDLFCEFYRHSTWLESKMAKVNTVFTI